MTADRLTMRVARADEVGTVLALLDAAAARLRGQGIVQWPAAFRVRLDCGAANTRLRDYYEAAGFVHRGDVELPEEWTLWSAGRPLLSRYERSTGR